MFGFTLRAASALVALSAVALVACPRPAAAQTALFDFESEAVTSSGALTSLMLTDSGITMTLTRPGSRFDIDNISASTPVFGSRTLSPFVDTGNTPFIADFSTALTDVSIDMGDFAPSDIDTLLLEAFSGLGATGVLLDSTSLGLPNTSGFTFLTVGVASPAIRSVRFIGGSTSFPNSVFYDHIQVTAAPDTSVVPEPSSLALLLGGGLPMLLRRRRKARTSLPV